MPRRIAALPVLGAERKKHSLQAGGERFTSCWTPIKRDNANGSAYFGIPSRNVLYLRVPRIVPTRGNAFSVSSPLKKGTGSVILQGRHPSLVELRAMSFPETRLTLIQRLAAGGTAEDWQDFLGDYWGPVCRFALRSGAGQLNDAEDVAVQTFEVLWESRLLVRWIANRTARLRSLLCSVTRKILANRHRVRAGRDRLARDAADHWAQSEATEDQQTEVFYAAWVEDLLRQAVESIAAKYYQEAKGDYVRVLYGRLCQRLSIAELASALDIQPSAVDNYFRHARQRLADALRSPAPATDRLLHRAGRVGARSFGRNGSSWAPT